MTDELRRLQSIIDAGEKLDVHTLAAALRKQPAERHRHATSWRRPPIMPGDADYGTHRGAE